MQAFLKQSIFKDLVFAVAPLEVKKHGASQITRLRNAIQRQSGSLITSLDENNSSSTPPHYQITFSSTSKTLNDDTTTTRIVPINWIYDCIAKRKLLPIPDTSNEMTQVAAASSPPSKKQRVDKLTFQWEEIVPKSLLKCSVLLSTTKSSSTDENDDSSSYLALDLDGTLIKTASGRKFALKEKYVSDWKFLTPDLPSILRKKITQHKVSRVIILSNQNGVSKNKVTIAQLKLKVESIVKKLNPPSVSISCYFALADDFNRKPRVGMATHANLLLNNQNVIYVGDAAGRVYSSKSKDFSASDLKFALNCGFKFYTPEAFFYNSIESVHTKVIAALSTKSFDPRSLPNTSSTSKIISDIVDPIKLKPESLIVLHGSPASGKSYFCKKYFANEAIVVSRDELGTVAKCKAVIKESMLTNKRRTVVVDNTNPTVASRAVWVSLASELKIPNVHCLVFEREKELVFHLNTFRKLKEEGTAVPDVAIHTFFKYKTTPCLSEGFTSVVSIPFIINNEENNTDTLNTFLL